MDPCLPHGLCGEAGCALGRFCSGLSLCSLFQQTDISFYARVRAWVIIGRPQLFELDAGSKVLGAATAVHAEEVLLAA